jgi:hypothetical protein
VHRPDDLFQIYRIDVHRHIVTLRWLVCMPAMAVSAHSVTRVTLLKRYDDQCATVAPWMSEMPDCSR